MKGCRTFCCRVRALANNFPLWNNSCKHLLYWKSPVLSTSASNITSTKLGSREDSRLAKKSKKQSNSCVLGIPKQNQNHAACALWAFFQDCSYCWDAGLVLRLLLLLVSECWCQVYKIVHSTTVAMRIYYDWWENNDVNNVPRKLSNGRWATRSIPSRFVRLCQDPSKGGVHLALKTTVCHLDRFLLQRKSFWHTYLWQWDSLFLHAPKSGTFSFTLPGLSHVCCRSHKKAQGQCRTEWQDV
jgi:hypothetical protein